MNLKDGIESTKELISEAEERILIYDGHFDPKIYHSEKVVREIQDAVDRGVSIEVLCDESANSFNPVIEDLVKGGKVVVHRRKLGRGLWKSLYSPTNIEVGHFMVVDGKHVREEEQHNIGSDKRKATIYYFAYGKARRLERRFYRKLEV